MNPSSVPLMGRASGVRCPVAAAVADSFGPASCAGGSGAAAEFDSGAGLPCLVRSLLAAVPDEGRYCDYRVVCPAVDLAGPFGSFEGLRRALVEARDSGAGGVRGVSLSDDVDVEGCIVSVDLAVPSALAYLRAAGSVAAAESGGAA